MEARKVARYIKDNVVQDGFVYDANVIMEKDGEYIELVLMVHGLPVTTLVEPEDVEKLSRSIWQEEKYQQALKEH